MSRAASRSDAFRWSSFREIPALIIPVAPRMNWPSVVFPEYRPLQSALQSSVRTNWLLQLKENETVLVERAESPPAPAYRLLITCEKIFRLRRFTGWSTALTERPSPV